MKSCFFILCFWVSMFTSCSDNYLSLSNKDITERDQNGKLIGNVDATDWGISNNVPNNIKKMFANTNFLPLDTVNLRSGCSISKDIRIEVFPNPARYSEEIRLNILNSKGLFKEFYMNISHLNDNTQTALIFPKGGFRKEGDNQYTNLGFFQGTPNSRVYYVLVDTNNCYYWGQGDIIFK